MITKNSTEFHSQSLSSLTATGYVFPEPKKRNITRHCRILATAVNYPERVVTNDEICSREGFQISPKAVEASLGAAERRVAEKGICDSDLLVKAAESCLAKAGVKADQLSKILVNKFLGDRALPMTAAFVQDKLNCPAAVQALDVDGGINSFLQAFEMARNLINMGDRYILIVSGGIVHSLTDGSDSRNAFAFGDGAAAVLIGPGEKQSVLGSYFFTGSQYIDLMTGFSVLNQFRGGDFVQNTSTEKMSHIYENGDWLTAKSFIVAGMKHTVEVLAEESGLQLADIDCFLITENHHLLWKELITALNIPKEKCVTTFREYGNTLSAMVPTMIDRVFESDLAGSGTSIMILSIGEGINAGGMVYRVE